MDSWCVEVSHNIVRMRQLMMCDGGQQHWHGDLGPTFRRHVCVAHVHKNPRYQPIHLQEID